MAVFRVAVASSDAIAEVPDFWWPSTIKGAGLIGTDERRLSIQAIRSFTLVAAHLIRRALVCLTLLRVFKKMRPKECARAAQLSYLGGWAVSIKLGQLHSANYARLGCLLTSAIQPTLTPRK